MDLRAQTTGTTGVTYSWNTSGLTNATSIGGTSTFDLTFTWSTTVLMSPQVDSVTLTATNASSQQESQTYYFLVPTTTSGSGSGPTWPTTLSPDTVSSSAPSWSGDGVSVNADSGALDTTITLPTYNPNVGALALTYDSLTTSPGADHYRAPHARPDQDGSVRGECPTDVRRHGPHDLLLQYEPVDGRRRRTDCSPGDQRHIACHRPLCLFGAGHRLSQRHTHDLHLQRHGHGAQPVVERRWAMAGRSRAWSKSPPHGTSGVILSLGDNGESLFFSGNPSVGSNYTTPAGNFSTLTTHEQRLYANTPRRHQDQFQFQRLRDGDNRPKRHT